MDARAGGMILTRQSLFPQIGLPPEQFAAAFPFHVAMDRELGLVQAGATIRRICPDVQPGANFAQIFRSIRPEGAITLAWALQNSLRFFLLEHLASKLQLRGEFVLVHGGETLIFLGSPWLTDASEISARGLSFDDFAIHDSVVDMLQVYQASKLALADAKKLAAKLTVQRAELRAANERLRQQEAETRKLALIAAHTDNAVVLSDATGKVVWVNEGFTRITGYTAAEILGKKPGALLQGPDTDAETVRRIGERLRQGKGFREELLNYAKDGRSYWVAVEVQPIHDAEGRLTNFMAIEGDITLHKKAEAALQAEVARRRTLFEQSADGIVIIDPETARILEFNTAAHAQLGYTREEFARLGIPDVEAVETREDTMARVAEVIRTGRVDFETLHRTRHGKIRDIHVTAQLLKAQGQTVYQCIWRDITARRAAQQRLAIQFEVSRVLAEGKNLVATIPQVLQAVCENLGWQVGQLWRAGADGLRFVDVWHPASAQVADFVSVSRATRFTHGHGLPGRVWATGKPVWIPDVTRDGNFPRQAVAAKEGLRGAIAFPVRLQGELWGVVEFFSRNIEEPDEALLQTFTAVGNQVGQFIVRREAEEALREANTLQQAILEGANYAIISTAPDGIILTFNSAAERMLGYTNKEMVGNSTPAIIHDRGEMAARAAELTREFGREVPPGFEAFVAKASLGMADEREWTYIRKDGSRFPVLLSVTALFDDRGKVAGYLGVASDITERKRVASELLKAKEAAEAANRAKSDFLAVMSHEIRTPMNAVLGMTNLLLETPLDLKQEEFARNVARSGEALIEIINDILDFSKIEAGEHFVLEEEVFSLHRLVEDVVQLLRPHAAAGGLALTVELTPEIPDTLKSDGGRLRQVLVNLVGNAIKFTDQGGVTIRVQCVKSEARRLQLRFEVQDSGIGMTPANLARLFQPFTQVDSSASRLRGGTGLGLAISKRIVELMGGRIGVESTPGEGSLFWFELDVDLADAPVTAVLSLDSGATADREVLATASPSPSPEHPLRILVAEDHDTNRRLAMFMLEKLSYRADFAGNGREAVEAWETFDHDVIFMDCQMPELDGFGAAREIRNREAARKSAKRVRIIALTANALKGDRERCLAAGMDGYISKPFTLEQLREVLEPHAVRPVQATPSPANPSTASASGFDRQQVAQFCEELGDEGVLGVVQDFLNDLPQRAVEMQSLAAAGRLPELARLAHSLQGIGRTVGLTGFSEKLLSLEHAANAADEKAIAQTLRLLSPEVEQGIASLQGWLATRRG